MSNIDILQEPTGFHPVTLMPTTSASITQTYRQTEDGSPLSIQPTPLQSSEIPIPDALERPMDEIVPWLQGTGIATPSPGPKSVQRLTAGHPQATSAAHSPPPSVPYSPFTSLSPGSSSSTGPSSLALSKESPMREYRSQIADSSMR
jgi:hypothetical protein